MPVLRYVRMRCGIRYVAHLQYIGGCVLWDSVLYTPTVHRKVCTVGFGIVHTYST